MGLKLTFVTESTSAVPGGKHTWHGIEGADATDVLERWHELPAWAGYDGINFRQAVLQLNDSDLEVPAPDEEILAACVSGSRGALALERT